jgi:hypothetical protein
MKVGQESYRVFVDFDTQSITVIPTRYYSNVNRRKLSRTATFEFLNDSPTNHYLFFRDAFGIPADPVDEMIAKQLAKLIVEETAEGDVSHMQPIEGDVIGGLVPFGYYHCLFCGKDAPRSAWKGATQTECPNCGREYSALDAQESED